MAVGALCKIRSSVWIGNTVSMSVCIKPNSAIVTASIATHLVVAVAIVAQRETVLYITSVGQIIRVNTIDKSLVSNSSKRAILVIALFLSF